MDTNIGVDAAVGINTGAGEFGALGDKDNTKEGVEEEILVRLRYAIDYSVSDEKLRIAVNSMVGLFLSQKKALLEKLEGAKKKHGIVYDGFSSDADLSIFNAGITRSKEIVEELYK